MGFSEILAHVDSIVLQRGSEPPEVEFGGLVPVAGVGFEVVQMFFYRVKPFFELVHRGLGRCDRIESSFVLVNSLPYRANLCLQANGRALARPFVTKGAEQSSLDCSPRSSGKVGDLWRTPFTESLVSVCYGDETKFFEPPETVVRRVTRESSSLSDVGHRRFSTVVLDRTEEPESLGIDVTGYI
ncbi:hypothetical protein C458_06499 [Haloferax sp. ATCC BAA-644]|nr:MULTISPECIES: hypothetical protein [unclassified Haloferax]ELZ60939.1 hypothetical protein C460_03994 [Haloferax sp. ATCC BAA-646]ELZ64256.1 hypothetical protein C459_06995 [Haloferax sp. ATCC BAA-645]ELZ69908.1 hypothetical protein C458_06499 [Haloferax sp. ATCC BAA-644]